MNDDYSYFIYNISRLSYGQNGELIKEKINVGLSNGLYKYIGKEYKFAYECMDGSGYLIFPGSVDTIFFEEEENLLDDYIHANFILRRKLKMGVTTVFFKGTEKLIDLLNDSQPIKVFKEDFMNKSRSDDLKDHLMGKNSIRFPNLNGNDFNPIEIGNNADFYCVMDVPGQPCFDLNYSDIINVFIDGKCVYDKN